MSPPAKLSQYQYKDEVINFILDKSFIELPIKQEILKASQQCLVKADNRELLLKSLEHDYKSYGLDYASP